MHTSEEVLPVTPARARRAPLLDLIALTPIQIAIAFALILSAMAWVEFAGPAILDNDGYYHIR